MKLSKKMQDAINAQIQAELYSSYLYLAMSAYCEDINMPGYARWLHLQTDEEMDHAMKFYRYIFERGGRVYLEAIQKPPSDFDSPHAVAAQVYEHEQHVTELIHQLYELALAEKDYATQVFLQWYIDEQVEEEDNARTILDYFEQAAGHPNAMLMLDRQLGARGAD